METSRLPRVRSAVAVAGLFFVSTGMADVVTAPNFVIRASTSHVDGHSIARRCETLRSDLLRKWHRPMDADWSPKCEIVIHPSRDSYRQQVGPGSDQTSGSSLIRLSAAGVMHRRIDLLIDADGDVSALPHELTHIVLADVFRGRKPPPWMDEGIATLEDSEAKRRLHRRDCRDAMRQGAAFRIAELLTLEQLSHPDQLPAFYGQSLSLTRFLVERRDPKSLIAFVQDAQQIGYDRAAKKHYGFDTVAELETDWKSFELRSVELDSPFNGEGHPGGETPDRVPFDEVVGFN